MPAFLTLPMGTPGRLLTTLADGWFADFRLRRQIRKRWWLDDWSHTDQLVDREAIIAPGRKLAVLGAGMREPDPDAPPTGMDRNSGSQRRRFTGTENHPLLISNHPKPL